jgi:hypothetical protein
MPKCSFCGTIEKTETPLCQSCGALRYPIEKNSLNAAIDRQKKIKLSATVVAAIVTPGSLIVLAALGANRMTTKFKKRKSS